MTDDLLDRFARTLEPADFESLADARDYAAWQATYPATFTPSASDDVDLRTYLLELRIGGLGADGVTLPRKIASLERFYAWLLAEALIDFTPFARFNFDRLILSHDQIRRREDAPASYPREREIVRLRALNRLAEELNRSAEVRTALDVALETVVEVMGLRTAWVSLLSEAGFTRRVSSASPPRDFVLSAVCGLPPALEHNDRYYLRRQPDCHCQSLLRAGRLTRAVNVVECTRLQSAADAADDTQGLLFHATVPIISRGRPLGILNVATDEWQFLTASDLQLLSAVGAQVAIALERARLYDLAQAQRVRLERELEMARAMQANLLPGQLPDIPGFGLAASWHSAREIAGDFYNIFPLADGRWGIVIADVADKGAAAAFYMVIAYSLIRAKAEQASSPAEALMQVNRELIAQTSAETFVTVFYAILDPATRTLTYANAGHNPPIVRRACASGHTEELPLGGLLLGMIDQVSLADATISLAPGDALVLYTDGLTEACNPQGEDYGLARLAEAITAAPAEAPALLAHLVADLATFTASEPQSDDITLFVVTSES
ncbi:MAG TPA: SpoIIE family protein phosphatase [Anaerolineae bacterium]